MSSVRAFFHAFRDCAAMNVFSRTRNEAARDNRRRSPIFRGINVKSPARASGIRRIVVLRAKSRNSGARKMRASPAIGVITTTEERARRSSTGAATVAILSSCD